MKHSQHVHPDNLILTGPLLEVTLEVTAKRSAALLGTNQTPPSPLLVKLLIDTGAQVSAVEETFAIQLGLRPKRFVSLAGISQQAQLCPVYAMTLAFAMVDDTGQKKEVAISSEVVGVSSPPNPHTHVGVLGRDILSHFRLLYEGDTGLFELSMPNQHNS
jgi:hypothetical protein